MWNSTVLDPFKTLQSLMPASRRAQVAANYASSLSSWASTLIANLDPTSLLFEDDEEYDGPMRCALKDPEELSADAHTSSLEEDVMKESFMRLNKSQHKTPAVGFRGLSIPPRCACRRAYMRIHVIPPFCLVVKPFCIFLSPEPCLAGRSLTRPRTRRA